MATRRQPRQQLQPGGRRETVEVLDVAHGGEGVGRIGGRVIFVEGAIPGETVAVEITEERPRLLRGRTVRVLMPSPDRIEPPCPIVDRCGGCQWQHIAYSRQLELKEEIVRQQLRRIGHFDDPPVEPIARSEREFGYRSTLRVAPTGHGGLGFRATGSHTIIPVEHCPVADPALNERLAKPYHDRPAGDVRVWGDAATGPVRVAALGQDTETAAWVTVAGRQFRISAGTFLQANLAGLETIIHILTEYLAPAGRENVVDAYCGAGVIGICLAPLVGRVYGIETSEAAVNDAAENGEQVPNFDIWHGTVAAVLPEIGVAIDAVILDPPRSGCDVQTIRAILDAAPGKILYVSCDPATLARDLRAFVDGGYLLDAVRPIDLFPQTFHIEAVARLQRAV